MTRNYSKNQKLLGRNLLVAFFATSLTLLAASCGAADENVRASNRASIERDRLPACTGERRDWSFAIKGETAIVFCDGLRWHEIAPGVSEVRP